MDTVKSSSLPAHWGAYCLANDEAFEWFQAFVRSFRKFNPALPLTVIPYNASMSRLAALQTQFNFSIMDQAAAARFDPIADRVAGEHIAGGTFRKLCCFLGDYSPFLFLDSDIVLTMPFDGLMDAFDRSSYDMVYFDTDMMVFKPGFAREMMAKYDQFGFNSGAFFARKTRVTEAGIFAAAETGAEVRHHFGCWGEQPFMNYLFQVSGCKMTHVNRLAPELTFKTKAWMPFSCDEAMETLRDPELGRFPLVHWAGQEYPTMMRPEVFLKYRTLGMSDAERAAYQRNFYYRRLRANLKEKLRKSAWFAGWVARRDERMRQKRPRSAPACQ
jgi:hypothetical protein